MPQACLVDGTYELFRAYYGARARGRSQPEPLDTLRAFALSLNKLKRDLRFDFSVVAFDTVIESFRNELFAGYKTGVGIPEDLWSQFPHAEEVAAGLGFCVLSMIEFEADDAIASVAAQLERSPSMERIVIASPDKDLMQCVRGESVVLWDRLREVYYDEPGVIAKMGVLPESIPDYLALVGDTADGIPGLSRWGARSAAAVLAVFLHLEAIPRAPAPWPPSVRGREALARTLAENWDEALLYRRLATLRTDVRVPEEPAAYTLRPVDVSRLSALGFQETLLERLRDGGGPDAALA